MYGAFAWRAPEAHPPLKVALGVWPGSETLIVGRESGRLDGSRIKLVEMAWSSAAMRTFSNRVVDVAVLSLDQMLRLRESGHDVRAIAVMDFSAGADSLLVHGDVKSAGDLRRKRVGAELRSGGIYLLARALAREGMTLADVDIVPLNQGEMETAFTEGELDAVTASEPWSSRLRAAGAVSIFDSRETPRELCRVLAVMGELLERRPDDLAYLLKVHFASREELLSGPPSLALGAVCRRHALPLEDFRKELARLEMPTKEDNFRLLGGVTPELESNLKRVMENMLGDKLLVTRPSIANWATIEILEESVK